MNSQFLPRTAEELNRQTHARLLHAAEEKRQLRGVENRRLNKRQEKDAPAPLYQPAAARPTLLAPAISAVATAALALQAALLLGF